MKSKKIKRNFACDLENAPKASLDENFPQSDGQVGRRKRRKGTVNEEVLKFLKTASHKDEPEPEQTEPRTSNFKKKFPVHPVDPEKLARHTRGEAVDLRKIRNQVTKKRLENKEKKIEFSVQQAARTELLLLEDSGYIEAEGYEETAEFTQKQIVAAVDITSATKHFELNLDFGSYRVDYTGNGRHLLLGGRRGHVAALDWVTKTLMCEINVMETVHDVKWLHVETMFATAQKDWVYIYDHQGTELHCIRQLHKVLRLEFLPFHFLLASSSESGHLAWLDVSLGKIVSKFHARMGGRLPHMTHNPHNATLVLGHSTGVVTMWSPMVREPLAKMLCHKTAIQAVTVDPTGRYIATSAMDRSLNVWDIRQMKPLQSYRVRGVPSSLALSHRGCLATATGNVVEVYRDCLLTATDSPYLSFKGNSGSVSQLQFCPYEDVLGVGAERGFCSIIVPGCGEANFDSLEHNPFRTKNQRKEAEVKSLLEKIQPELISLDPLCITEVDVPTLHDKIEAQKNLLTLKAPKIDFEPLRKNKKGGGLQAARTKKILQEQARKEFAQLSKKRGVGPLQAEGIAAMPSGPPSVLDRFKPRPRKQKPVA